MTACDGCARDYNQPHKNDCNYYGEGGMIDMTTTDEKIRAAIKIECDRQHVGEDEQRLLYFAYYYTKNFSDRGQILSEAYLLNLGMMIEPHSKGQFRTTPVSFNGVVGGVPPQNIARSMESWIEWFNACNQWRYSEDQEVEDIVKEFLDIHPFSDGNGRTAWLLRVWMLNQWDDPQPLPDYYKEV